MSIFRLINYRAAAVAFAATLMAGMIFSADVTTPHGTAFWLLYLVPLLLSPGFTSGRGLYLVALLLGFCVVLGYFVSGSHGPPDAYSALNRALIFATLLITAYILSNRQMAQIEVERAKADVEKLADSLREANRGLAEEVEKRRALEQEKAKFLAMVSHDMKSPLAVISGYADLLEGARIESLDDDTRSMVESMNRSARRVLKLVEDFVSLSRLEAGKLKPNMYTQNVGEALRDTAEAFSVIAGVKGLKYHVELPDGPVKASLDWNLVQRAVSNLVDNAINYTPPGGEVDLRVFENNRSLVIEVSDTGPGIPDGEEKRIFEAYSRCGKTSRIKGSGLGLAVVKAVAESHGGRAELESVEGKGSLFRMVYPRLAA